MVIDVPCPDPPAVLPPPGHSRSSTISFSVTVGTMNAFFSPRNTNSEFNVLVLEVPIPPPILLLSIGDIAACVTFRSGSSEARAPSLSATADSTNRPSTSGHFKLTLASLSNGTNTFNVSINACKDTSKDAVVDTVF
jgi:hypothetical protein